MLPTTTTRPRLDADTSPFAALDADVFNHVLDRLRRDPYGNATVTGHVLEAFKWRVLGRRFRDASRAHPSDFDGAITTLANGEVDKFTGGMRFTALDATHAPDRDLVSGAVHALYLVRDTRTGQVHALTTFAAAPNAGDGGNSGNRGGAPAQTAVVVPRQRLCALDVQDLARVLSGHNADFDRRLTNFDRVAVHGVRPRVSLATHRAQGMQVVAGTYLEPSCGGGRVACPCDFGVAFKAEASACGDAVVNHIVPTLEICALGKVPFPVDLAVEVPPQLADGAPGERVGAVRREADARRAPGPSLPHLSIAFGWYHEAADVECGRWQVSLYRPNLAPKALLPRPSSTDPESATRFLADRALLEAKRKDNERRAMATTTALVVFDHAEDARRRALLRNGGPAASLVTLPRARVRARAEVRRLGAELCDTDGWGRLAYARQPADSHAAEAEGEIDDRFRASTDDAVTSSDDEGDSDDEEYVPPSRAAASRAAGSRAASSRAASSRTATPRRRRSRAPLRCGATPASARATRRTRRTRRPTPTRRHAPPFLTARGRSSTRSSTFKRRVRGGRVCVFLRGVFVFLCVCACVRACVRACACE